MIPFILKHGTEDWRMETNRFILDDNVKVDLPKVEVITINKS
jgi:hypothetical protein